MSEVFTIGEIELCSGVGNLKSASLCVMAAAAAIHAIEKGEPLKEATDQLECACPVIRNLVIKRNDSFDNDADRTKWGRRLIPRIIASKDESQEWPRAIRVADTVIRKVLPELIEKAVAKKHLGEKSELLLKDAQALRELPEIITKKLPNETNRFVKAVRDRCAAAYANAYAYAAANAYAYAAYANAYANAYAYAYANAANKIVWKHLDPLIEDFLGFKDQPDLTASDLRKLKTEVIA